VLGTYKSGDTINVYYWSNHGGRWAFKAITLP
jgi:hypothetical protein